jgi:hypothetical protein
MRDRTRVATLALIGDSRLSTITSPHPRAKLEAVRRFTRPARKAARAD